MDDKAKLDKLWQELHSEAEEFQRQRIPDVVITRPHAPEGYTAEICVKKFKIYGRLVEEKARSRIVKDSGEYAWESGQWKREVAVEKYLSKALAELNQIVNYRAAMDTKKSKEEPTVEELI